MDITVGMLLYVLSLDTTIYTNIDRKNDNTISGFEIWEGDFPQKHILYLVTKDDLQKHPELWYRRHVILRGGADIELPEGREIDWISLTEHLSAKQVQQKVLQSMQLIYDWYIELQKSLLMRKSLTDILNLTDKYLQISAGIFTREMMPLGVAVSFIQQNSWVDEDACVSISMVNDLIADEDFQKAEKHTTAFWFCNFEQEWYCCHNLGAEGKYDARLITNVSKFTKEYGQFRFVQILGEAINSVYEEIYYRGTKSTIWKELIVLADLMLKEKNIPHNEQKELLARYQWKMNDVYQVILFRFQEGAGAGIGMKYFQEQILRLFRECCVIPEPTQFICIRNVTRSDAAFDFADTLPYFLRDTLCKAGISNQFSDFSQLLYHYRAAEYALLTGEVLDGSKWYHHFSKYTFRYLIENCTAQLLPTQIRHPALNMLKEYDQSNNTELLLTLDIFLQNRQNITRTAEQLKIHRTTLLARIERIQTITKIDLDDHKTCLHIMISYELMK